MAGSKRAWLQSCGWWLLPLGVLGLAIAQLRRVPALPELGAGSSVSHRIITQAMRNIEPAARRRALESFPGDTWSQGDDFSNSERNLVRGYAGALEMRPGAVLDVIDRDVKAMPGAGRGSVPPCMPRPFYE